MRDCQVDNTLSLHYTTDKLPGQLGLGSNHHFSLNHSRVFYRSVEWTEEGPTQSGHGIGLDHKCPFWSLFDLLGQFVTGSVTFGPTVDGEARTKFFEWTGRKFYAGNSVTTKLFHRRENIYYKSFYRFRTPIEISIKAILPNIQPVDA